MTDATAPTTVKLGGVAGTDPGTLAALADHAGPGWVLVHGGGQEVAAWSRRLGLQPRVVDGRRVTDAATLDVVVAVLRGLVNARLVAALTAAGLPAIGLSGVDAGLFDIEPAGDGLGAVGLVTGVRRDLLDRLSTDGLVPVVAPIASDGHGQLYNINADEVAGAVAAARGGRLLLLTDVPGVMRNGASLDHLDTDAAQAMLVDGSADGGMRPKLRAAIAAARAGCDVRIVDGTSPSDLFDVLAGEPGGTAVFAPHSKEQNR